MVPFIFYFPKLMYLQSNDSTEITNIRIINITKKQLHIIPIISNNKFF